MCTYTVYNITLKMGSMKLGMNGNRSMGLLLFNFVSGCTSHMSVSTCARQKNFTLINFSQRTINITYLKT